VTLPTTNVTPRSANPLKQTKQTKQTKTAAWHAQSRRRKSSACSQRSDDYDRRLMTQTDGRMIRRMLRRITTPAFVSLRRLRNLQRLRSARRSKRRGYIDVRR